MKLVIDAMVGGARGLVLDTFETKVFSLRKRVLADGSIDDSQIEVEALIARNRRAEIQAPLRAKEKTGYGWKNGQILRTTARLSEGRNAEALAPFLASQKSRWCIGNGSVQQ